MKTLDAILEEEVSLLTQALFERYGIDLKDNRAADNSFSMIAIIGFSGTGFKGSLGFAADQSLIEASYIGGELSAEMIDDWLGEISNQLLGRMNNSLVRYGLSVHLSTPMVLHGLNISVAGNSRYIHRFQFQSSVGNCTVWVDSNWDPALKLTQADEDEHAVVEGETIVF